MSNLGLLHAHKTRVSEVHAHEIHAYEMHTLGGVHPRRCTPSENEAVSGPDFTAIDLFFRDRIKETKYGWVFVRKAFYLGLEFALFTPQTSPLALIKLKVHGLQLDRYFLRMSLWKPIRTVPSISGTPKKGKFIMALDLQ